MGPDTVRAVILETCDAICQVLEPIYLPDLTTDDWLKKSKEFEELWNLCHCCAALDGKNIEITCPRKAGSL